LELLGYTIVESSLDGSEITRLASLLEKIHAKQLTLAGGSEEMARMGEANTVRAPLLYEDSFTHVAANKALLALVERMLGGFFILMQQNGILIQPAKDDHTQAQFHRDLPYQHFVSSRPIAINALLCLDAFSEDNGGTIVIPGSHRMEEFPSDMTVRRLARSIAAKSGDFIVLDCMLYHRAGANRTGLPRRGVNHVYALPFIRQQITLPTALNGRHRDDPALRRLLGYETDSPVNVEGWYAQRKARW
jgi:ectoine hydroxylase-related dioxygenase (phytanoyl-CoA dioxygenase family)